VPPFDTRAASAEPPSPSGRAAPGPPLRHSDVDGPGRQARTPRPRGRPSGRLPEPPGSPTPPEGIMPMPYAQGTRHERHPVSCTRWRAKPFPPDHDRFHDHDVHVSQPAQCHGTGPHTTARPHPPYSHSSSNQRGKDDSRGNVAPPTTLSPPGDLHRLTCRIPPRARDVASDEPREGAGVAARDAAVGVLAAGPGPASPQPPEVHHARRAANGPPSDRQGTRPVGP